MVTMTPDKWRQLRRIGVFAGFGLVVFVIAFYASFPYDRAKEAAIRMASKNWRACCMVWAWACGR